jgi:hypothetical protein
MSYKNNEILIKVTIYFILIILKVLSDLFQIKLDIWVNYGFNKYRLQ